MPASRKTANTELIRRALAAWFRHSSPIAPTVEASEVREVAGLHYVVLRFIDKGETHLCAVYRVLDTPERKQLKRMVRWPAVLNGGEQPIVLRLLGTMAQLDKTMDEARKVWNIPEGEEVPLF